MIEEFLFAALAQVQQSPETEPLPPVEGIDDLSGNLSGELAIGAYDFSLWALFSRADWVVKSVMLVLILASLWSWALIFQKTLQFARMRRASQNFLERFFSGIAHAELYRQCETAPQDPAAALFVSAMREWKLSGEARTNRRQSLGERIDRAMAVTLQRELDHASGALPALATIGASAPFIGLFGTVWGIMNSFQAIAFTQQSSLAIVAPGIAEALFATALGLLAAIPAVIGYNRLNGRLSRYGLMIENFADELAVTLSRRFDELAK